MHHCSLLARSGDVTHITEKNYQNSHNEQWTKPNILKDALYGTGSLFRIWISACRQSKYPRNQLSSTFNTITVLIDLKYRLTRNSRIGLMYSLVRNCKFQSGDENYQGIAFMNRSGMCVYHCMCPMKVLLVCRWVSYLFSLYAIHTWDFGYCANGACRNPVF